VSTTGLVTGRIAGNASVLATFRRGSQVIVSDPLVVEVDTLIADTATTRAIEVTCHPYGNPAAGAAALTCLPSGLNFEVHCQATGRFTGDPGTPVDITDQVTWVTTSTAIARSTGLVAFLGPEVRQSFRIAGAGIARLYARQGTRTSLTTGTPGTDPWAVQGVALGQPASLRIEPPAPAVAVGGTAQLQAMVTFAPTAACAAPPERDFSLLVDWASEDESIAEVSFFGEATGLAQGSVTIGATYVRIPPMLPLTDTVPLDVTP
jgi:hypothetical protein